ncbi:MAG TPA: substrate-binding domain-containing protein [Geminicoccus sp.]|jgi:ABC-type sugar transport system substrate-binding protein|uniref:substrate-binding domain-containing protein n=1 Tax=Geminicoccus sp. TaxID=2024832 RepID=UPI002E303D64|nr:substrate-binding domain-containing protein [Geminicoccus sp.]HEX2528535.1 substrate-binding domain-containing protein [Geminicoccus sp.]
MLRRVCLLTSALVTLPMAVAFAQERQPITNATCEELAARYEKLPFTNILPVEAGPVMVDGEEKPITIGFSQTGFNHPWRVSMLESLQAEACRHPNIELVVLDGNVDVAKQNNDIRDLIARGVNAVIMSPVESAGLVPAARAVMNEGLPLVVLDRDVPTEKTLFIGQSNVTMGEQVAEKMAADLGGKGKIVVITGLKGSSPAVDRDKGMKNVLAKYPDIEVLATGDGQWIREPAVPLMEDWLTAQPEITAVFSHAEESAWGAQLAIARANRCKDGIRHYTFDGSNAGFKAVKAGTFGADGNYTPFIGDIGLRAVIYQMTGKPIPEAKPYDQPGVTLTLPDSPVVTAANADEWIGRGWGDFEPTPDPCR